MSPLAEPAFLFETNRPISSSPLLADANRDTYPEVFVGGRALYALDAEGRPLARWPQWGRRPFASSPAFGDINGDHRQEIVAGCDDGRVYAFHLDGEPVPGWPVSTGGDVFSTPALVDLDRDGAMEVVVGSDDGSLYVFRGDGTTAWRADLPGRPFLSASPGVADLDGDGSPEILMASWAGRLHGWKADGTPLDLPFQRTGSVIWSSPLTFRTEIEGWHVAWASDGLYMQSYHEDSQTWQAPTTSWAISSPALVQFRESRTALVLGADRLYGWDLSGRSLPGWPVDVGDYIWSSPVCLDLDGDGIREVIVGSWDGGIHAFREDGTPVEGFPLETGGPIFSSPAAAPLPEGGGLLVIASWDGTVRGWRLPRARFAEGDWTHFRGFPNRCGQFPGVVKGSVDIGRFAPRRPDPRQPKVRRVQVDVWYGGVLRIRVDGDSLEAARRILVHYRIPGEARTHPSPVLCSRDGYMALIQPLRLPAGLRFWIELEGREGSVERWPPEGSRRLMDFRGALEIAWKRTHQALGLPPEAGPDAE